GRDVEAAAALEEADRLGRLHGDARAVAFSSWGRARIAARRRDPERTLALVEVAAASTGDWFEHHSGVEFLAEAATLLAEVGLGDLAADYLDRARSRREEAPRYVLLAEGTIAARTGDPRLARELLGQALALPGLEPRARWRATLLQAWAAHRAGSPVDATALAGEAVLLASACGHQRLPALWEPEITAMLVSTGSDVATHRRLAQLDIRVLGGFEVRRDGDELVLPPGRPRALVALLAAFDGRIATEQAIEALWPEADTASGRKRLRNVLNRLRAAVGDVVVREEALLVLATGATVDASVFAEEASRALAHDSEAERGGRARAALARYTGELLPEHRYEDWAVAPRERLRGFALRLADLLAEAAADAGELDDALRYLEQGIAWDGLDEARYLGVARVLLAQGRRGRALEVLRRGAAMLRGLGLDPSDAHRALVRSARG
ncbi:MAG: hypothetical protein FJW96_11640, partial [Actinobacteria bacterium]|nr:hypothetical protein [Actinomycetota bacterium]